MQRITITIDDDLLETLDELMTERGYTNRSEAIRDLVREHRVRDRPAEVGAHCVATLTYVYDHATRELARRITRAHHERHDLSVASMRVHLDHDSLLESSVLRGRTEDVMAFADGITSQRGVRYANLHAIPARVERELHSHGDAADHHDHLHV
ncbi:nickel-responsive transcriptional regulator NikR [Paraburkholderia acidisoli]|uniref:Putative nickel-responsive regulator n=1 Tax=Paraburkholderia acidisoli TaxID=2571748 RepID=A0A7Z2JK55_9BURK|nr:nickel-responsive transcriptional regulator NikR [Paraburkholderia acidisoli]QGZ66953.1 nickel-responsive transcriptional regulator NikR [Paraburkholderia acidisoli]